MFSLALLAAYREWEMRIVVRHLAPGAAVLEVGSGTGQQAKLLTEAGFRVSAIDVAQSLYRPHQVFPVLEYDGAKLPFPDRSFDVVFTSSVLEHVRDLPGLHREMKRVLRRGGFCLHVLPTACWRLGTSVSHYGDWVQRQWLRAVGSTVTGLEPPAPARTETAGFDLPRLLRHALRVLWPPRHGEVGSSLSEIWRFSRFAWIAHFRRNGLKVVSLTPLGLFYTGHMVLGRRFTLPARHRAARLLGSATMLYKVEPSG